MPVVKSYAANARHLLAESGNLHHKILPTPANTLHRERKAFLVLLLLSFRRQSQSNETTAAQRQLLAIRHFVLHKSSWNKMRFPHCSPETFCRLFPAGLPLQKTGIRCICPFPCLQCIIRHGFHVVCSSLFSVGRTLFHQLLCTPAIRKHLITTISYQNNVWSTGRRENCSRCSAVQHCCSCDSTSSPKPKIVPNSRQASQLETGQSLPCCNGCFCCDILPRLKRRGLPLARASSRFSFEQSSDYSISELSPCVPRFLSCLQN